MSGAVTYWPDMLWVGRIPVYPNYDNQHWLYFQKALGFLMHHFPAVIKLTDTWPIGRWNSTSGPATSPKTLPATLRRFNFPLKNSPWKKGPSLRAEFPPHRCGRMRSQGSTLREMCCTNPPLLNQVSGKGVMPSGTHLWQQLQVIPYWASDGTKAT